MSDDHSEILRQLTGVWRLVSSEFRTSSGGVLYPLGEDAQGQAIFTGSGYMSGQLMRRNRPAFASGDQASGTEEEVQAALQGYVAYYGPCEVDVANRTLTTHVEGSMFPNWVGGEQVRFYELTGDQLVLKTTPIPLGDEEIIGVLTWERKC